MLRQDTTAGKPTWPAADSLAYHTCIPLARSEPAAVGKSCSLLAGGMLNQMQYFANMTVQLLDQRFFYCC